MQSVHPANDAIAQAFERTADLLEAQHANPHRVRSYREGARTLRAYDRDAAQIFATEGEQGLLALEHIGHGLAAAVAELLTTGRYRVLERLQGEVSPEKLFASVPGIGPELAHRIVGTIHSDSLEDLELAAHDGRLETVPGFGPRRVRLVRTELAALLSGPLRRRIRVLGGRPARAQQMDPDVGLLLEIDEMYRERAVAGTLARIAPRRFNKRAPACP